MAQADTLAAKIGEALGDDARVTRPTKTASIRVSGLDDSASEEEIRDALASAVGCPPAQIRVGAIASNFRGAGSVIASCPVESLARLAEAKRICVGWSVASIEVLEQRPLRCYRCMAVGHPQQLCPSTQDRSRMCYRCGVEGHVAVTCTAPLRCAVCADCGLSSEHRMGGIRCKPPSIKGRPLRMGVALRPTIALATPAVNMEFDNGR